jgi:hypothetical protein
LSVSYTPEDIEAEEEPIADNDKASDDEPQDSVEATLAILESRSGTQDKSIPDHEVVAEEEDKEKEEVDTARKDRVRRSLSLNLPVISGKRII